MALSNLFFLTFIFTCVRGEALFKPCNHDDIKCLRGATQTFLSKTYGGYPQLGIKQIDPLIIPSTEIIMNDDLGLNFQFKNVNITGLKNLEISDFKLDTEKFLGLLKMKVVISIVGNIEVTLTASQKTFNGDYFAEATVLGSSEYSANLQNVNGKEYFVLGPETTSCEIVGEPTVTLGNELQGIIDKDVDAVSLKPEWETKKAAIRKRALCAIGSHAFATIIHNLRAVARAFDKSAFFTNV